MTDAIRVSSPITGTDKTMSFEAGHLAQLADGAVLARHRRHHAARDGHRRENARERAWTSSPSRSTSKSAPTPPERSPARSFAARASSSDQAILICRLIDRPLRPSFPKGFRNEVQVVGTIFSADQENPHDILAINAASAALMISGIPFDGPIGAVRMAYTTEGVWAPHPTFAEGDAATFELVVAGRALSDATPTPTSPS